VVSPPLPPLPPATDPLPFIDPDVRQEFRPLPPQHPTQHAVSDPWLQHNSPPRSFAWRRVDDVPPNRG
jgi:hypothetical protein